MTTTQTQESQDSTYKNKLYAHLKWAEGYSEVVYPDSKGISTIGIGHNIQAHPLKGKYLEWFATNGRLSSTLIYELLDEDMAAAEAGAKKLFPMLRSYSVARQVALVDLVFVLGETKLKKSFQPTIAHIKAEEWEDVALHLENTQWYKDVKKRGLRVVMYIREG